MRPVECFFSVFSTSHITSEPTRFHYVLQQLPPETITTALDIIKNQATLPDPYTRLKNKLTHTFGKTKYRYQMCDELLDMPALGLGKPSLLMSNMLALLPEGDQPGTLFCVCFYADCQSSCAASSKLAAMKHQMRCQEPLTTCGRTAPTSMPLRSLAATTATTPQPLDLLAAKGTPALAIPRTT